jgi:hypothetical protein
LLPLFQITGEFGLDFLDAGETGVEGLRQGTDELVFGHANGLVDAGEGVFGDEAILRFAEEEANGGLVIRSFHLGIHGTEVEIELACVLGLEGLGFEFDDDVALQPGVVEEEIEEELVASDDELELAAHEGETGSKFQKETSDVTDESVFDIAFVSLVAKSKEVEVVGVFEDFGGESGLRGLQASVKVCHGQPLAKVELVFDLNGEGIARPGMLKGLAGIPFTKGVVGQLGEEGDDVEPGQLVSSLLTVLGGGS